MSWAGIRTARHPRTPRPKTIRRARHAWILAPRAKPPKAVIAPHFLAP
jgi:hypothetical protein